MAFRENWLKKPILSLDIVKQGKVKRESIKGKMLAAPVIIDGAVMVPSTFFLDTLNVTTHRWDEKEKSLYVSHSKNRS